MDALPVAIFARIQDKPAFEERNGPVQSLVPEKNTAEND
jgi:hypothetical protein